MEKILKEIEKNTKEAANQASNIDWNTGDLNQKLDRIIELLEKISKKL